jgi:epoxyqueuosine reductase QueG
MQAPQLPGFITSVIHKEVSRSNTTTRYREPLVGFVAADDPGFADLRRVAEPTHLLPEEMLTGAKAVVSFFLPFAPDVVQANKQDRQSVAYEWALAYIETNKLIGIITARLIEELAKIGVKAAAQPATHSFDPETLVSRWSHKSIAVLVGLGSFGLHHLVITDAGCAGRFGSLVIDAALPISKPEPKERCDYYDLGNCLDCVLQCPADALDEHDSIDKQACWARCLEVSREYEHLGVADVCGKCAVVGPCALESAV